MESTLVLAKPGGSRKNDPGSGSSGLYIIVDGNIVEVFIVDDQILGICPKVEPQWELGEVEISPKLEDLDLGDKTKIIKAQDNPLLSGLELVKGTKLEVVLVVNNF